MLERNEDKRYAVKFACLDSLVPEGHLLRKIEKAIDFEAIYPMVGAFVLRKTTAVLQQARWYW